MVKTKHEVKKYVKTEKVLVSERRYCDHCGKEITGDHWKVTTGHNDWGYESPESVELKDICSKECLSVAFHEYCERSCGDDNSEYFEVYHYNDSDVKGDIKYDQD